MQIIVIVINYALMMMIGIIDNIKGPIIVPIKLFFNIDYTYIGLLLFLGSLGFIIASFIGGIFVNKYGTKTALIGGLLGIILGISGFSISHSYTIFLIFFFIMNFGLGMLEIGINATAAITFLVNQALMMNLLHFFYGFGATISPNAGGRLIRMNVPWQKIYFIGAIIAIILMIIVFFVKFPGEAKYVNESKANYFDILRDKHVIIFSILLGFYIASEVGVGSWAVSFLNGSYNMNSVKSSFYLSLFFGTFTIGRLFGGFIAEKIGYVKAIYIFATLAIISISGSMINHNFAFLLSIGGLFYSIIYPTTIAIAMKKFKRNTGVVISVIVTISSAINMFTNFIIGRTSDAFGVNVGFSLVICFMFLVIVMLKILSLSYKRDIQSASYGTKSSSL